MPRTAFTHSWLENGLIPSLYRAIRLLHHDILFIPSNYSVTFLTVAIMKIKVKNIGNNIFSGNWLCKNGVHIQCCKNTVKPRFNVPAFSEILDLVMIFFMSQQ
jgi:hypothetical protein